MKTIRAHQAPIVLASVFFTVLMSGNCFAQCITRISGRVTLDGTAPVAHQDMYLLSDNQPEVSTRTNTDGYYSFRGVCIGAHTVRPGPAWWENAMLPSPYRPSSRRVFVREPERGRPAVITGINFERTNPPGQGGPRDPGNFIEDKIKIDESVRGGDLKFAREIEQFLESTLPCKEHLCDLTIKVRNGRVAIVGVTQPNDRPLLDKLGEAIGGNRVDVSGVRSKEQP